MTALRLLALYNNNIEFQTIVGAVAERLGQVPVHVRRRGDTENVTDHAVSQILTRPNPEMSGTTCRILEYLYMNLLGETIAVCVHDGVQWWYMPVPPPWVTINEDGNYEVQLTQTHIFTPDEIIHIKNPNVCNPFGRGIGRGWAGSDEAETSEYAAKHSKNFYLNNATPDLLIVMDDSKDAKLAKDAERDWNNKGKGFIKAWKTRFLAGKLSVHELSSSFGDLGLIDQRKFHLDALRKLYRVPPELIGQLDKSNRATIEAALVIEAEVILKPQLRKFNEELEYQLLKIIPDTDLLYLEFENPAPEDKAFQLKVMKAFPGAHTGNEARALSGCAPRPDMNVYMREADEVWEIEAGDIIEESIIRSKSIHLPVPESMRHASIKFVEPPPIPQQIHEITFAGES